MQIILAILFLYVLQQSSLAFPLCVLLCLHNQL